MSPVEEEARAELRDAVMELVEVACSTIRADPGAMIRQARLTRIAAIQVVAKTVLAERAAGITWEQVAEALGLPVDFVVEHYGPMEQGSDDVVLLGPWEWQEDER